MQQTIIKSVLAAILGLVLGSNALAAPDVQPGGNAAGDAVARPEGTDWIAKTADNVCGINNPKRVSNPARVSFDQLLEATEEIKKLKRDKIDPDSPEGIQLRQKAKERVTKACEAIRKDRGHCGIWKAIRHKDGRQIPDVTSAVKSKLKDVR